MTLDLAAKKAVLRSFTYGLYAVSATDGTDRGIFTANWVTQVSFEPPMLAVSIERDSSTLPIIRSSELFTVAPLRTGQREIAGNLGRPRSKAGDKVAMLGGDIDLTVTGSIAFAGGLGYCVCRVVGEAPAGDSVIVVGGIIEAVAGEPGDPLTMKDAGFRHFG